MWYGYKIKNKSRELGKRLLQTLKDDSGVGVVEVILILVVLIGLVIIFKTQLTNLVTTIFEKITSESSTI
nr:Flp1 family type IVb pilin [uncultured Mediterraneibacter sp.]